MTATDVAVPSLAPLGFVADDDGVWRRVFVGAGALAVSWGRRGRPTALVATLANGSVMEPIVMDTSGREERFVKLVAGACAVIDDEDAEDDEDDPVDAYSLARAIRDAWEGPGHRADREAEDDMHAAALQTTSRPSSPSSPSSPASPSSRRRPRNK